MLEKKAHVALALAALNSAHPGTTHNSLVLQDQADLTRDSLALLTLRAPHTSFVTPWRQYFRPIVHPYPP